MNDFDRWMKRVDEVIERRLMITSEDLPDVDYYGMFDSSLSPSEAASEAIRQAGYILGVW
jgi:hypothetical protein